MKFCKLFLLALFTLTSFCVQLEAKSKKTKKAKYYRSECSVVKEPKCKDTFFITQDEVNHEGFIIRQPGVWVLAEDIDYSTDTEYPAITIAASNVTLNLNHKVLSLKHGCGDIVGIYVNEGLGNITIKDGTVKNFPRAGIFKDGPQVVCTQMKKNALSIDNCNCPPIGFRLLNIQAICNGKQNIENNQLDGMGGAVIFGTRDVLIENSAFLNNAFTGLQVSNAVKVTVKDSRFDDNISSFFAGINTFFTSGAFFDHSDNIVICGASFNSNFSENEAHGLFMLESTNISVQKVQAHDTNVSMTTPEHVLATGRALLSGIGFTNCNNIALKNAQTYRTRLLNSVQVPGFCENQGIRFLSCGSFDVEDSESFAGSCVSSDANQFDVATQGINISNSARGHVRNCQFTNQTNSVTATGSFILAQGFDCVDSFDIEVDNCYATNNVQTAPEPRDQNLLSIASGFKIGECSRVIVQNCVSVRNIDEGFFGGGFGFTTRDNPSRNIRFINCIAEENRNALDSFGAGFFLFSCIDSEIAHCKANTNSVGIQVSGNYDNCLVHNNTVTENYVNGIFDSAENSTVAYYQNVAKNNGPDPVETNYRDAGPNSIFPDAFCEENLGLCTSANLTPIRLWALPLAPCAVNTNCNHDNLDNISIVLSNA